MAAAWWTGCLVWISFIVHRTFKWYKYVVRQITGTCELERVYAQQLNEYKATHEISVAIAKSFKNSMQLNVLKLPKQTDDFDTQHFITSVKRIKPTLQKPSAKSTVEHILRWIDQEKEVKQMIAQLTRLANEVYSSSNTTHEASLEALWKQVKPGISKTGRITKEWQEIGFQGVDPQTDFRAMGMLGLLNLLEFSTKHQQQAISIVEKRNHYPFAIGGISITKNLLDLCRKGEFDYYFYKHGATVDQFHELYSTTTVLFSKYYEDANPPNILYFEAIMKKFTTEVSQLVS